MRCWKVCLSLAVVTSCLRVYPCCGLEKLPCWDRAACFDEEKKRPSSFVGFVGRRPGWHKELDNIQLRMRQDADYSILYDWQKDRIPYIHTVESQNAVDELAGSVASAIVSPLVPLLPLYTEVNERKEKVNLAMREAIPEITARTYSVKFQPRADFSQTNPISMDIKVQNGGEIAVVSLRIRETEAKIPLFPGITAVGGYSFRDSAWYAYVSGRIRMPW